MRVLVVGLGIQGRKRMAVAGKDLVATVDPHIQKSGYEVPHFTSVEQVPLESFDGALLCIPDGPKVSLIQYLLKNKKHVLVEKPLFAESKEQLSELKQLATKNRVTCYTAYNHRFEPHFINMKKLLDSSELGRVYYAKFYYGNGTARDVQLSEWKDSGFGVLPDLGSHLLDTSLFLFGSRNPHSFKEWSYNCFENKSFDQVLFHSDEGPKLILEASLLSWRNHFTLDVYAEKGSAHIDGLCKWGPSYFRVRSPRILPSGKPDERVEVLEKKDPTWLTEYQHFQKICLEGQSNLDNDIWIYEGLNSLYPTREV